MHRQAFNVQLKEHIVHLEVLALNDTGLYILNY